MSAEGNSLPRRAAAALLGISPDTLDRWADAGRFTTYRIGGGRKYDEEELIAYKVANMTPRAPMPTARALSALGTYEIAPLPEHVGRRARKRGTDAG